LTRFPLVPSPLLALAIVLLHGVAAGCVLMVLPGAAGAALAVALFLLGAAAAWSRALLRSPASVRAIEISGESLTLELRDGAKVFAEAAERRFVSRFVVTLPMRRPRRTILVSAGMMAMDDFRRLRIWALWGRLPGVAAAQLPA
jgi:hypothetical protein